METVNVKNQYNQFHQTFSENQADQNEISKRAFHKAIDFNLQNKSVLDVGCGDGEDLMILGDSTTKIHGVDPSDEFLRKARRNNPRGNFVKGVGENLPFADNQFDVVISKWAIQTSIDVPQTMREMARVLKPGGYLVYLSGHPLRQWIEKVKDYGHGSNYYDQLIVTSIIFDGLISVKEPSHTMSEYLNKKFFHNFEMIDYEEGSDFPASEQINGDTYPTYILIKARKK